MVLLPNTGSAEPPDVFHVDNRAPGVFQLDNRTIQASEIDRGEAWVPKETRISFYGPVVFNKYHFLVFSE